MEIWACLFVFRNNGGLCKWSKWSSEFEFDGSHRYELGRFSDVEVEEYDESSGIELGKKTVLKLTEKIRDRNYMYHVCFDNYFTGLPLLEELLQRGTHGSCTIRINRNGLPQ